jgi:hypothetical protein
VPTQYDWWYVDSALLAVYDSVTCIIVCTVDCSLTCPLKTTSSFQRRLTWLLPARGLSSALPDIAASCIVWNDSSRSSDSVAAVSATSSDQQLYYAAMFTQLCRHSNSYRSALRVANAADIYKLVLHTHEACTQLRTSCDAQLCMIDVLYSYYIGLYPCIFMINYRMYTSVCYSTCAALASAAASSASLRARTSCDYNKKTIVEISCEHSADAMSHKSLLMATQSPIRYQQNDI